MQSSLITLSNHIPQHSKVVDWIGWRRTRLSSAWITTSTSTAIRTCTTHEESSNDSSKIHRVKPSGHAALTHYDGNGSNYRYEDCHCIDCGDVKNCENDIYTFHHIHHGKSCEKIIIASSSVEGSIPPIEPSKAFNLTLFFGSRLLNNQQHLIELNRICLRIDELNHITNSHPVLVIDIESCCRG